MIRLGLSAAWFAALELFNGSKIKARASSVRVEHRACCVQQALTCCCHLLLPPPPKEIFSKHLGVSADYLYLCQISPKACSDRAQPATLGMLGMLATLATLATLGLHSRLPIGGLLATSEGSARFGPTSHFDAIEMHPRIDFIHANSS